MKIQLLGLCALVCVSAGRAAAQTVTVSGTAKTPITITPDKSTGLNTLIVVDSANGAKLTYKSSSSGSRPVWYSYSNLGGGYAQEVAGVEYSGNESTLAKPTGDMGYIIEDGTYRYYLWLTDYSNHRLTLRNVEIPADQGCGMTELKINGNGDEIIYYSINGRKEVLSREISVEYQTLEWDSEAMVYNQVQTSKSIDSLEGEVFISPAPLCNTTFYVTGDRFLTAWGEMASVESDTFHTNAVDAHTTAEQVQSTDEKSNMISSGGDSDLGGSAPADITFRAYVTDAVIHNEWQFATDAEFEDITMRFTDQELNYVFTEEGTTYVRFIGSNSDGTCETEGETYTVSIGASELKCPNAFSPGVSEGVNDIWKVSYRSLIEFKCWIFDRYGTQLFYFEDPTEGWDGKYRGKLVKPGVYYYVIEAVGSEGKRYKKSGDINILRYKTTGSSSLNSGTE
jgi:gliding motility-associated-like protein